MKPKHVSVSITSVEPSQKEVKQFLIQVGPDPDIDKLKSQWHTLFEERMI